MIQANEATALRVRRASEIEATGDPAAAGIDRYLIESRDSNGMVAVVEYVLAPRVLAAPLHRHSREDEYSIVLEGLLGVFQHVLERRRHRAARAGGDHTRRP